MQWLNRTLLVSPMPFALCLDEKAFHKELKRLRVPVRDWPPMITNGADATTHFLESSEQECAIVCLGAHKGRSAAEVNALLVHEAVHLWQEIRRLLGEKEPSSEFEAYSIQSISLSLMDSYAAQRKRR